MFLLLSAVFAFSLNSVTVSAQEKKQDIKIMATANLSDTPAQEGVGKILALSQGNSEYELTPDSPRSQRVAAKKLAGELYKANKISYEQYAEVCKSLNLKPKAKDKL